VPARQAGVVAHGLGFGQAGEADGGAARERAEAINPSVSRFAAATSPSELGEDVEIDAGGPGRADLEGQRLLQRQRAVAGESGRHPRFRGARLGAPAAPVEAHASTSSSAAAHISMSSGVTVSVTATTSPFSRPSPSG